MSTLDDIAQERQRLAERLARIDGERAKLAEQLAELEAAERVLSRFTQASPRGARRGRRAATAESKTLTAAAAAPRGGRRGRRTAPKAEALSLGDATLRVIGAHGQGVSAEDVRQYLSSEFGIQVRPNHLGMALQRHRRGGRLDQRDSLWYPHQSAAEAAAS